MNKFLLSAFILLLSSAFAGANPEVRQEDIEAFRAAYLSEITKVRDLSELAFQGQELEINLFSDIIGRCGNNLDCLAPLLGMVTAIVSKLQKVSPQEAQDKMMDPESNSEIRKLFSQAFEQNNILTKLFEER